VIAQTLSPAALLRHLPNLTARVRQILPGDFLLNAADEPIILVTKVEILHGAHPRVRISGVTTPRAGGKKRGYVKTLRASQVARIMRPVLV
jgi:hypothetical protein